MILFRTYYLLNCIIKQFLMNLIDSICLIILIYGSYKGFKNGIVNFYNCLKELNIASEPLSLSNTNSRRGEALRRASTIKALTEFGRKGPQTESETPRSLRSH